MTAADTERTKFTGGCACGEIRFGFYEPITAQAVCHCRACQYANGGGPAYVIGVQREQFRITRGHPREFATLAECGALVTRAFCGTCGTPLLSASEGAPETYAVSVGSLDDPGRYRPRQQTWTSEAPKWHPKFWRTARFRRNGPR